MSEKEAVVGPFFIKRNIYSAQATLQPEISSIASLCVSNEII